MGNSEGRYLIFKEDEDHDSGKIVDILSWSIVSRMWHVSDRIFCYLDAVSLVRCEIVCPLWRDYIRTQRIWPKVVERAALAAPALASQNGWNKFLPVFGGRYPDNENFFRYTYWKMTNLNGSWSRNYPGKSPSVLKNKFRRSGAIVWAFLPNDRAVSVYNKGKGFVLKIHDQRTFRFRCSQFVKFGTSRKDNLCLDATPNKIAVGGFVSQKVWVFTLEETPLKPSKTDGIFRIFLRKGPQSDLHTYIYRFMNAGAGISKLKLHSDEKRLAVLMPLNQTVEVWGIDDVVRLQTYSIPSDSSYLLWEGNLMLTAPIFSGIIQVFDTKEETEKPPIEGSIRRIDAVAKFEKMCATGESRSIRIWSLGSGKCLVSWIATKNVITALLINDTFVISGSSAGIVKLWDLKTLLSSSSVTLSLSMMTSTMTSSSSSSSTTSVISPTPLRKISMKGILHYPIKNIFQSSYTEVVIVAKYEAKKKKDKIKVVQVALPIREMKYFSVLSDSFSSALPSTSS